MILSGFAVAGILVGLILNALRGEKTTLSGIAQMRGLWLPILGALLDGLFSYAPSVAIRAPVLLTVASYSCVFIFLLLNRRYLFASVLMAAGSLSNFCVIAANRFRMPISPAALVMYPGMTPEAVYAKRANYFIATNGAKLYPLGDIIPVPLYGWGGFVSVGDLVLGVGLTLFIVCFLIQKRPAYKAKHYKRAG